MVGRPRIAMRASSSRATRNPDSEVSAMWESLSRRLTLNALYSLCSEMDYALGLMFGKQCAAGDWGLKIALDEAEIIELPELCNPRLIDVVTWTKIVEPNVAA